MSDKGYGLCGIANFICFSREFVHFHLHSAIMLKIIHQTTRLRGDFLNKIFDTNSKNFEIEKTAYKHWLYR